MAERFETQLLRPGIEGLDLTRSADLIPPSKALLLTNAYREEDGNLRGRPGQTTLATAGTKHHSIARINSLIDQDYQRFFGVDTNFFMGKSGPLTQIDSGYSGDPLYLLPYRLNRTSDSWLIVADREKNRQYRRDGTVRTLGLPKPLLASTAALAPEEFQRVGAFDGPAGAWVPAAGSGGAGSIAAVTPPAGAAAGLSFTTAVGAATAGYYNIFSTPQLNSLNVLGPGGRMANDEDYMRFWLRMDRPDRVLDVKVYFVCGDYTASVVPGTSATQNTDAFVGTIRATDFTTIIEQQQSSISGAARVVDRTAVDGSLETVVDTRPLVQDRIRQRDPSRIASIEASPGRGTWTHFGIVGIPFRRRDFLRIGSDETRGWDSITGVVVVVSTNTNQIVVVSLADMSLVGGYGPDSGEPGASAYDYRYVNFDTLTGDRSNPSPSMTEEFFIDSTRGAIQATPSAYGVSSVRQAFFRRGGSLKTQWYFVGINSADGAPFMDTRDDNFAVAAGQLEFDNDQPISTLTPDGTQIFGQALPVIIGPIDDMLVGFGDPYRPGDIYWPKPGRPGSWPTANRVEVCPPTEELMGGCLWNGSAFIFSRLRGFQLTAALGGTGTFSAAPTGCAKGLLNRWAVCAGIDGVYFVSPDGSVNVTTGGPAVSITDDTIRRLFEPSLGTLPNGMEPVDQTQLADIRLSMHKDDLYFLYRDMAGFRQAMVYNIRMKHWRHYNWGREVVCVYSEEGSAGVSAIGTITIPGVSDDWYDSLYIVPLIGTPTTIGGGPIGPGEIPNLLLGGAASGKTYTAEGVSDDGFPITGGVMPGFLDQSAPRQQKLYGDLVLDIDRKGLTIAVEPFYNSNGAGLGTALPGLTINTGANRTRYTLDPFAAGNGTGPLEAYNVTVRLSWSGMAAPVIYLLGASYIVEPDTIVGRVTDWDFQGRLTDKMVKGVMLECDTKGLAKTVQIEADGALQTTITVNTAGRRSVQFSWAQFEARLLRLRQVDSNEWMLFQHKWIFDEEPAKLSRWESQYINHGINGWHTPLYSWIKLRSTAIVTLTLTAKDELGNLTAEAYSIASTGGLDIPMFVPFRAGKGMLYKYLFTSPADFLLYREESAVAVQFWGGDVPRLTHPFGNDDLDRSRGMGDAFSQASTPGGAA